MLRTPATWLLFFHVAAALWLAAGTFAGTVVRAQIKRSNDLREKVVGLRIAHRLMRIYTTPGGIIAGLLGIPLIGMRGHQMNAGWIHASLTLWAFAVGVGLFYLAPRLTRTLRAAEASLAAGAPTAELQTLTASKLPAILADVNALIILLLTFLMVMRPF